jgi:hypothetical protein
MKPELFTELRKLRNEIAHGTAPLDPAALAERLSVLGLPIPPAELPKLIPTILQIFGGHGGIYYAPNLLAHVVARILDGRHTAVICDPWAGIGAMLATACAATHAAKALAFTQNESEAALGRVLVNAAKWQVGDPLELLNTLKTDVDIVASILPFGSMSDRTIVLKGLGGNKIEVRGDLGQLILAAAAMRLSADGIGLFVIPPSFFISQRSVLRQFNSLGLSVEAALALPSGSFAPYTNIQTYLLIVRKRAFDRMFVAQLSSDTNTNIQIVSNLAEGKEGGALELGRFVEPLSFTGLNAIRTEEHFQTAEREYGAPALRLENLATAINLGRYGEDFKFHQHDNAIYVPLIGNNQVAVSLDELQLKLQNYVQVVIDPKQSNARFVAQFLNSNLGTENRELSKSGFIPKLNKQTIRGLRVFVPDLETQKTLLEIESRIIAEHNTLSGLQIELDEFRQELWSNPRSAPDVNKSVIALSSRLSGDLKQYAVAGLEQWFETLPFPLSSILRAWQATPSQDFKTKHEHLLHFFEGTAEFISVIFLSAYRSNEARFETHQQKLLDSMQKQKLSFEKATFGTWKFILEYLGSQTRQLLSGDKDARALCADIFSDKALTLPEALCSKELAAIISTTNKLRNDWTGHGGMVGQDEARGRNEQLLGELQKLRDVMADAWAETQLIHALHTRARGGVFENEVAILMGSNSEFLKETRPMSIWLDVERLYLSKKERRGLEGHRGNGTGH